MPDAVTDSEGTLVTDELGVFVADESPALTPIQLRWIQLWNRQTRELGGIEVVATIQGDDFGPVFGRAIISKVDLDEIYVEGTTAQGGGWNIQMLLSDFTGEPPKQTPISCNGEAEGHALEVLNFSRNNGIAYILSADFTAVNKN